MGSKTPSPAKVSSSRTLKLPPSRVRPLELVSHSARCGRGSPDCSFQTETFSAAIWDWTVGTRAERFFKIVIGSLSLYSKRSPSSWAEAADWDRARAASTEAAVGGEKAATFLLNTDPPPRPAPLPSERPFTPDTLAFTVFTF